MKSQYAIPFAIVVVGLLVAGGIFLISRNPSPTQNGTQTQNIKAFDPAVDHIMGNPNAPVKVVEYADLECPYCKQFEPTMDQLMQYYGPTGKVAWVYRNFPLGSIHSKAPEEHQAAECAADQGGSTAFFKYIDRLYAITPSENGLDLNQLPKIAQDVGLDVTKFNSCLSSNKYATKVRQDYNDAIASGFQGTPTMVITANGTAALTLSGDQPYASMRAAIDQVLQNIGQTASSTTTTGPSGAAAVQGGTTAPQTGGVQNY
jgi:protein-disulfide isomerase